MGRAVLQRRVPCDDVVPLTTFSHKVGPDPRALKGYWGFSKGSSPEDFTYPLPPDPEAAETIGVGTAYRTTWMRRSDGAIVRERRPGVVFSYDRTRAIFDRMMATFSD